MNHKVVYINNTTNDEIARALDREATDGFRLISLVGIVVGGRICGYRAVFGRPIR